MAIKNDAAIRAFTTPEHGAIGVKILEALQEMQQHLGNVAQQVNANPTGQPAAPPSVSGLKVVGQNGHFTFAITDQSDRFRGVRYYLEHADNPHFQNSTIVSLHDSRNGHLTMGDVTRYFRAYSAYATSESGAPAYHGSEVAPLPVQGGGSIGGPAVLESQSSGTGTPGVGLSGPGPVAFTSPNGIPPSR